jgi:hypothetical protein
VTGIAEELDDIYVRLNELDIDVVEGESGEAADGRGIRESKEGVGFGKKRRPDGGLEERSSSAWPRSSSRRPTTRCGCTCARWER